MHRNWLIGIAAVALAAGPALAQGKGHGGGNGGGNGGGGGHAEHGPAQANGGGGQGGGNGGGNGKGQGGGMQAAAPQHGNGGGNGRADRGRDHGPSMARSEPAHGNGKAKDKPTHAERGNGQAKAERMSADRGPDKIQGKDRVATVKAVNAGNPAKAGKQGHDTWNLRSTGDDAQLRRVFAQTRQPLIDGCPPGLAAKNNGCRPPGLARQQDQAWQSTLYRPDWWGYNGYSDGRYYYDDGYLYRLGDRGGISGFIPLLGGALGIGNGWPSYYQPVALPDYYQRYYGLGPADTYRYADDVIYRVDPGSSAITSIAALLTGDTFNVGQRLPVGYDAYNVPYPYRDQYYDTPDDWYRYSDGYVYEVDPKTQLITAAIELLGNVL